MHVRANPIAAHPLSYLFGRNLIIQRIFAELALSFRTHGDNIPPGGIGILLDLDLHILHLRRHGLQKVAVIGPESRHFCDSAFPFKGMHAIRALFIEDKSGGMGGHEIPHLIDTEVIRELIPGVFHISDTIVQDSTEFLGTRSRTREDDNVVHVPDVIAVHENLHIHIASIPIPIGMLNEIAGA